VTLDKIPLPDGFRAVVDAIEEHSRTQPERRQKAKVIPNGQPLSHNRPRHAAGGQGDHARGEQARGEPRSDRNRRRRSRGGGQRSASGGQRG
jgi:hypothetical protein